MRGRRRNVSEERTGKIVRCAVWSERNAPATGDETWIATRFGLREAVRAGVVKAGVVKAGGIVVEGVPAGTRKKIEEGVESSRL